MSRASVRRQLLQGFAATMYLPARWSCAAGWPDHPVRVVVPFPPGGTTDYVARLVTNALGASLGATVVVDNKPGAGTVIGVDAVAKSAPDGYTLACVANSFAVNQSLVRHLPYDGLRDLQPVALMGLSEHVLAAHPSLGLHRLADLVALCKAHPGTLSYASFGNGTSAHLAGEMLRMQLGVDIVHVPYKGQAPALSDLLGGHVSMMFGNWPEFREYIESGKLSALGMATSQRSMFAPSLPTLAEQGARVESNSWSGLLAPARTSEVLVARLNTAVNAALASRPVAGAFVRNGIVSRSGTTAEFGQFINAEIMRYARVIRDANIQLD